MYPRSFDLPKGAFFLFGPRGTGKSTLLRELLPTARRIDLLDTSAALLLTREPHRLESVIGEMAEESWIVIDEVQKVPALLDEVHRLIEDRGFRFALSGSSARKLKRGGANLLAGRAVRRSLEGLSYRELGNDWRLAHAIEWGGLPQIWNQPDRSADTLDAYLHNYLKEEIREEGVVRSYPPFLRFLSIAGQLNGQEVNGSNIAREAMVPRSSIDGYFSILVDTLLGHFLPAYQPRLKTRERAHPKFYWFDPGVARAAAGRLFDPVDSLFKGRALETWIYHELRVYNEYARRHRSISYYGTTGMSEIDFVIETRPASSDAPPQLICVEVKLSEKWNPAWERPIRELAASKSVQVEKMVGVYLGPISVSERGFHVYPVGDFLRRLHDGEVF